jgi:O-antigen ligase
MSHLQAASQNDLRSPRTWVWLLLGIAPAIMAFFTPRSEWGAGSLLAQLGLYSDLADAEYASLVNRLLNYLILGTCALCLATQRQRWNPALWSPGPLAFFLCTLILPLHLSMHQLDSIPSGTVVWPAVAAVLLVSPPDPLRAMLKQARTISLFYVYCSLIVAVIFPNWSLQPDYDIGLVPFMQFRLYGLSAHANQLGMIAFLAFLLCLHQRKMDRSSLLGITASIAVIVLAQSKSFFLLLPMTFAIRWCHLRFLASSSGPGARLGFAIGMALAIAAMTAATIAMTDDRVLSNQSVSTLTARTEIWKITLEEWSRQPLFGYGPSLWDQTMAERYEARLGQIVGGHSHNQFIQLLGQSGLIGLILFLGFLVWFLARSIVAGERQDGLGVCLAMAIVVRGALEPFYYPQIIDLGALSFILAVRICMPAKSETDETAPVST